MKIKKIMSGDVASCAPDADLVTAARTMLEKGCGALPVVADGKVLGMITDRDICVALASDGKSAIGLTVDEVMSGDLCACSPDDDIKSALKRMQKRRVRRLPVVNGDGGLVGILSMSDLMLNVVKLAGKNKDCLTYKTIAKVYKSISGGKDRRIETKQPDKPVAKPRAVS